MSLQKMDGGKFEGYQMMDVRGKLFLGVRGVRAGTFHVPNAAKSLFQPLTVISHVIYRRFR